MDTIIQQAYHILEQKAIVNVQLASILYERCCSILRIVPTPLLLTEPEEPDEPPLVLSIFFVPEEPCGCLVMAMHPFIYLCSFFC